MRIVKTIRARLLGPLFVAVLTVLPMAAPPLLLLPAEAAAQQGQDPVVVVLVRHAEREQEGQDPPLVAAGHERAKLLAAMMTDSGLSAIFTTALRRTKETAAPAAAALRITPAELPKDMGQVRALLLKSGPRVLIVGHSNTVPLLVEALGGPAGLTIEDNEFDGMYVMTVPPAGPSTLLRIRYGAPPAGVGPRMAKPR